MKIQCSDARYVPQTKVAALILVETSLSAFSLPLHAVLEKLEFGSERAALLPFESEFDALEG